MWTIWYENCTRVLELYITLVSTVFAYPASSIQYRLYRPQGAFKKGGLPKSYKNKFLEVPF